jgi:hypothetical protein
MTHKSHVMEDTDTVRHEAAEPWCGDGGDHECEFCSPEPEIIPLPRSGAARAAAQRALAEENETIGDVWT